MLEKQGRDDDLRERFGLAEDVDLGEEDIERSREMWEAGRERRGLLVDEVSGAGMSVRAVAGTPSVRRGKATAVDGAPSSLVKVLRQTTAKKYDPFAGAAEVFSTAGLNGQGGSKFKVRGKIKDPGVLDGLGGGLQVTREDVGMPGGLLAGYGSD